jgi:MFS family permease
MLTGFGPFVTVYLSANHWQPTEIGFALSVGTMAAIAGQVPAGMLVDAVPYRRLITAVGIVAVICLRYRAGHVSSPFTGLGC